MGVEEDTMEENKEKAAEEVREKVHTHDAVE